MSYMGGGADVAADWVVAADVKVVTKDPENVDLYEWSLEYSEAVGIEAREIGGERDSQGLASRENQESQLKR